jgi:hypothetical protein
MPARSKYGAKPVVVDGIRFASQAEARRYGELKLLLRAGEISELALQPRYPFFINRRKVFTYVADFSYFCRRSGKQFIEDVKGVRTDVFKLKKKLIEASYGIRITEIPA